MEWHSVEWSNPKLRPILDGNAECQSNQECHSGVQSKTPAYFGLECGLHSKSFGVPNALRFSNNCQLCQMSNVNSVKYNPS